MMKQARITREELEKDNPGEAVTALLGTIPGRWGRMSYLSRLVLVETAHALQDANYLQPGEKISEKNLQAGLIGGTQRGSLFTDNAFIETMKLGPKLASPALFGYTLPNTPLAEAAVAFGLKGPVYAVFNTDDPMQEAVSEARRYLEHDRDLNFMLACAFDHFMSDDDEEIKTATVAVVTR